MWVVVNWWVVGGVLVVVDGGADVGVVGVGVGRPRRAPRRDWGIGLRDRNLAVVTVFIVFSFLSLFFLLSWW